MLVRSLIRTLTASFVVGSVLMTSTLLAQAPDSKLAERDRFFGRFLSDENIRREECWDISTHHGAWKGVLEITIMKNNDVLGYVDFPPNVCGERNTVTGTINQGSINLSRHCDGLGGVSQNYSGVYSDDRAIAEGLITGPGAGEWNAVVHVISR